MTGVSSPSKMSNSLIRDCDGAGIDATMRSSFYSTQNGFNKTKVVTMKFNNVLELSSSDLQKIE